MDTTRQMFSLKLITWIMIIAMGALPIVGHVEGKDFDSMAFFPILMLGCTLCILYPIIQSLNNRVKELEERLKNSQLTPERSV